MLSMSEMQANCEAVIRAAKTGRAGQLVDIRMVVAMTIEAASQYPEGSAARNALARLAESFEDEPIASQYR